MSRLLFEVLCCVPPTVGVEIKIFTIGCTAFKARMHQIQFRLAVRPTTPLGAYSAPQTPSWIFIKGT